MPAFVTLRSVSHGRFLGLGVEPSQRNARGRALLSGLGLVLAIVALPRLILGEDSIVTIHDNLDSEFVYRVWTSTPSRLLDGASIVSEALGGLPRAFLPSGLNITMWFFCLFSPFVAYAVNEAVVHMLAFVGMFLLVREHVAIGSLQHRERIAVWAALPFALLPFYTILGLSVAGQPLFALAFANLFRRRRLAQSYVLLATLPFYSSLVTTGTFVLAIAVVVFGWVSLRQRRFHSQFAIGIGVLALGYLFVEHDLLRQLFSTIPAMQSHRSEWSVLTGGFGWSSKEAVGKAIKTFLQGHYHAPSLHKPILLGTCVLLVWAGVQRRLSHRDHRVLGWGLAAAVVLCTGYGFSRWEGFYPVREWLPFLKNVRLRFFWLQPILWYLVFSGVLLVVSHWRRGRWWVRTAGLLQLSYVLTATQSAKPELRRNYVALLASARERPHSMISYREFVAQPLFDEIKAQIGRHPSTYRVASVGLQPSVAQLNGLSTVDGYHNNYPLAYKERFRRVIAAEIAADESLRKYFDTWGSRLYVFNATYGQAHLKQRTRDTTLVLETFRIDVDALIDLECDYLLSVYDIRDPAFLHHAVDEGVFVTDSGAWRIHLYRLVATP